MIVFPKNFIMYGNLLSVGNIVLVDGKISVKDEEVKLLAEKISVAPKTVAEIPKEKINQPKPMQLPKTENTQDKKKKSGIFIKIPTENPEKIKKLKIFEGRIPVYLYYEDAKKYDFLGMEYLTSVNEPMTNELKHIFDEENVVVRE